MKNSTIESLSRKDVWTIHYKEKLVIEIVHWGVDRENGFKPLNNGQGTWNYYILIPENLCTESQFNSIWLEDQVKSFENGREYVSHDYFNTPITTADWHCGVTYYQKIGHSKGHRLVKFGCDFSHYYDSQCGFIYTLEEVFNEATTTANQILKWLEVGKKEKQTEVRQEETYTS